MDGVDKPPIIYGIEYQVSGTRVECNSVNLLFSASNELTIDQSINPYWTCLL